MITLMVGSVDQDTIHTLYQKQRPAQMAKGYLKHTLKSTDTDLHLSGLFQELHPLKKREVWDLHCTNKII